MAQKLKFCVMFGSVTDLGIMASLKLSLIITYMLEDPFKFTLWSGPKCFNDEDYHDDSTGRLGW